MGTKILLWIAIIGIALLAFTHVDYSFFQKSLYADMDEVELHAGIYECSRDFPPGGYVLYGTKSDEEEASSAVVQIWKNNKEYAQWGNLTRIIDSCLYYGSIGYDDERRIFLKRGNVMVVSGFNGKLVIRPDKGTK